MYNTDERRLCPQLFQHCTAKEMAFISFHEEYHSQKYDGRFKDIFEEIYQNEFKALYAEAGITLRTSFNRRHGCICVKMERQLCVWAVRTTMVTQSDTVAQGFGSLGLMTSTLELP